MIPGVTQVTIMLESGDKCIRYGKLRDALVAPITNYTMTFLHVHVINYMQQDSAFLEI